MSACVTGNGERSPLESNIERRAQSTKLISADPNNLQSDLQTP